MELLKQSRKQSDEPRPLDNVLERFAFIHLDIRVDETKQSRDIEDHTFFERMRFPIGGLLERTDMRRGKMIRHGF